MFAAILFAAQSVVTVEAPPFLRSELPALEEGYTWRRIENPTYSCSIGYFAGNFVDFSVKSSRAGLDLSLRFREGHDWYQGSGWLDHENRIFLRQIVFERSADDDDDYFSTYDVDTSSTQSRLEQGYTAMISSPASLRGLRRDPSLKRMTVYESDFLRRLETSDHLTIIAEDARGKVWTYRLNLPEDIGPQIAWQRECADRYTVGVEPRNR